MKKIYGTFIILTFMLAACGSKKHIMSNNVIKGGNIMEARLDWLKDKKSKYDFQLALTNVTNYGLIVYLNDIQCAKGGMIGEIKHTFFNTGERTIDFRAGESKTFRMVCKLPTKVKSKDFKITVQRISDNPSGDGKTTGKVVHQNLVIPVAL